MTKSQFSNWDLGFETWDLTLVVVQYRPLP
jgi:hypothetical protein